MLKFGVTDSSATSEVDQEAKKLKRDLETWRELILPCDKILSWEKQSYPLLIISASSFVFLLLWYLDPSIITAFSLFGLLLTLIDYFVPLISAHFTSPDQWTAVKEKKLEEICKSIAVNKLLILSSAKTLYNWRNNRPRLYYVVVIGTLLTLSWIGNTINNLLLTYIVVTLGLLSPGLKKNDQFKKYTAVITNMFGSSLKSLSSAASDDTKKSN